MDIIKNSNVITSKVLCWFTLLDIIIKINNIISIKYSPLILFIAIISFDKTNHYLPIKRQIVFAYLYNNYDYDDCVDCELASS